MTIWSREDTKIWIDQLENRVDDIQHYIDHTSYWCQEREVVEEQPLAACLMITILWVCMMRGESVSRREVMELLGISQWDDCDDFEYMLDDRFGNMELNDVLEEVLEKFTDNDYE